VPCAQCYNVTWTRHLNSPVFLAGKADKVASHKRTFFRHVLFFSSHSHYFPSQITRSNCNVLAFRNSLTLPTSCTIYLPPQERQIFHRFLLHFHFKHFFSNMKTVNSQQKGKLMHQYLWTFCTLIYYGNIVNFWFLRITCLSLCTSFLFLLCLKNHVRTCTVILL